MGTQFRPSRRAADGAVEETFGVHRWLNALWLAVAFLGSGDPRFFNQNGQVNPDAIGDAKGEFQSRVTQSPFNETQHGLRDARALPDGVFRQLALYPLRFEQPDSFGTDRLMMASIGHIPSFAENRLDSYFAIVKYCGT